MDITLSFTGPQQRFRTSIVGVTFSNPDGSSRQSLVRQLRRGEAVTLVRDADNAYDKCAIAVHNSAGSQLGFLPAGDVRLADHLDSGGAATATVVAVTGGPGLLGRILKFLGKPYGCIIEVTKTDPDWRAVQPYMEKNRQIEHALDAAKALEETDSGRAIASYREIVADIVALDALGRTAASWRRARYPVNRLSLLLDRSKDLQGALDVIVQYERYRDLRGISPADQKSIASRKGRLISKLGTP